MANKTKITEEVSKQIIELHSQGFNNIKIGEAVGVSRETIKTYLLKINLTPNSRQEGLKKDSIKAFIEEVRANGGINWTASRKKYGLSFEFAKKTLEKAGVKAGDAQTAAVNRMLPLEEVSRRISSFEEGSVAIGLGSDGKYSIKTKDGHVYKKDSAHLHQGNPTGRSGTVTTIEKVESYLNSLGYTYIGGFTKVRSPLEAKHDICGNVRENRLKNFKNQDCSFCAEKGTSRIEKEILGWIQTFYPKSRKSYIKKKEDEVKTGRKLEIDIYIDEIKIGIEYCGIYWHSEDRDIESMTAKQLEDEAEESKHYKKMLRAKENGIRIITIFGNDWHYRKEQIKSYIQSAIGKNEIKIPARKTEIKHIDRDIANAFFDKYHIQGRDTKSFLFWGLFYGEDLVGAMSAGKHPQRASEYIDSICLNRMAFRSNTTVIGGASKLFEALRKQATKMEYKNIISWSDNRWSEGNVYKKLGFDFSSVRTEDNSRGLSDGSMFPECYYVKGLSLISRAAAKKRGLTDELNIIWDCGKKRWIYPLPLKCKL